ncbi:MAG: pyridoxal 5'-phosphate synthase glutaminase subunit PdxT [Candidatus Eremiobacteraeota bacterium]|nr:pyridoxal 5'-phosphate synthase glutaminase subunit PdxT [Candidatus Eremiobacteraeota bacterium]
MSKKPLKIGVLAMQGAFEEHIQILDSMGIETIEVRLKDQLADIDGLIIPGGESTTMGKMLNRYDLLEALREKGNSGFPMFGTCAGMIMMSKKVEDGLPGQPLLELMDITTIRNAFGRQIESFEADLDVSEIGERPFHGVFIRAPIIKCVNGTVDVLARFENNIVAVRQDNLLATSFHPEIAGDSRFHEYFVNIVEKWKEMHGKD